MPGLQHAAGLGVVVGGNHHGLRMYLINECGPQNDEFICFWCVCTSLCKDSA